MDKTLITILLQAYRVRKSDDVVVDRPHSGRELTVLGV